MADRYSEIQRKTSETDITMKLGIDGSGAAHIDTGIGFFDHMLNSFARHGFFDLDVTVRGDLHVDCHHTIEDTGIVLGDAIKKALGDKKVFGVTVILYCRWMRRLPLRPSICPAGLILCLTHSLRQSASETLIQKWSESFFMPFPTVRV